jgi:stress-induced morphogen
MSIDTYEPMEEVVIEQDENFDNFSVERIDSIENDIDQEDKEGLIDEKENFVSIDQFVLDMRGGEPEDWKLTYQESGSKFDGKELFGQDGVSLTEIIRNSDLSADKILGHEDMLNHFRSNDTEPYMLPDWIEQDANGEEIIHVTVASIDKEGNVSYETWTHQKEKPKEEEEDKEKDKNDNINPVIELEEVIEIEEKEIININKVEENNLFQNEEVKDAIFSADNHINNNENITKNESNKSLDIENTYSTLEINVGNKEIYQENNLYASNNNEVISSIKSSLEGNIDNNNSVNNKEEVLVKNEIISDKKVEESFEKNEEVKEMSNIEEKEIINEIKEEIGAIKTINNEFKDSTLVEIVSEKINGVKDIEITNAEEIKITNYTEDKDIPKSIDVVNNTEIQTNISEKTISNDKRDIVDKSKEEIKGVNFGIEKNNVSVVSENESLKEDIAENINTIENNIKEEIIKNNNESISTNNINNEKQNGTKEVKLEKDIFNILDGKENIKITDNNIKVNYEDKKEIVKEKTLEERLVDLFRDEKVNIPDESKNEKQNTINQKEIKEDVIVTTQAFSKEINVNKTISFDKKEVSQVINLKTNNEKKETPINKLIINEIKKDRSIESNKDLVRFNIGDEKITKNDLTKEKEEKISGHEILMKTLGLSSKTSNEGLRVVYSNINQYKQKDEDDNNKISSNRFVYKPSNLNGISLKIRA